LWSPNWWPAAIPMPPDAGKLSVTVIYHKGRAGSSAMSSLCSSCPCCWVEGRREDSAREHAYNITWQDTGPCEYKQGSSHEARVLHELHHNRYA
jgi:hypothetical protein